MVTIRDIAKATGLSVATVSMVLNRTARRIPIPTQRLVEKTARELGYSPNFLARSLRSKRTNSVGVLIFDITDPYCALTLRGLEASLAEAGYMPVLADLQNKPERLRQCTQMLMAHRVDGLVAIANPIPMSNDIGAAIRRLQIPAVVIGSKGNTKSCASVLVDNRVGTRLAVEHLYDLGHRKIAVIRGPETMIDSVPRWEGISACAVEKGIPIHSSLVETIRGVNSTYEEGYSVTQSLLRRGKRFTALIAFDDLTAFAAIGALTQAGICVPDDCSVIGFDDIPGAAFYNPPLTTICQYLEKQGVIAAEMMRAMLVADCDGATRDMHRILQPSLVIRKSTARAIA